MRNLYNKTSHFDKPVVELLVINDNVQCECGELTIKLDDYIFKCPNCPNEYMGPLLRK